MKFIVNVQAEVLLKPGTDERLGQFILEQLKDSVRSRLKCFKVVEDKDFVISGEDFTWVLMDPESTEFTVKAVEKEEKK